MGKMLGKLASGKFISCYAGLSSKCMKDLHLSLPGCVITSGFE